MPWNCKYSTIFITALIILFISNYDIYISLILELVVRLGHIYGLGEKTSMAYLHVHACYNYYNCYYLYNYISLKKDRSV